MSFFYRLRRGLKEGRIEEDKFHYSIFSRPTFAIHVNIEY